MVNEFGRFQMIGRPLMGDAGSKQRRRGPMVIERAEVVGTVA